MSNYTIGILGGGQLARYLYDAAQHLKYEPLCLCSTTAEPAATHNRNSVIAPEQTPEALREVISRVNLLTFENEFVDTNSIRTALGPDASSVHIHPSLDNLHLLSDKLSQKKLLEELNLPHSKYIKFDREKGLKELPAWLSELKSHFTNGVVLKWAKYGYDGYGTRVLTNSALAPDYFEFAKSAFDRGTTVFAEELIHFSHERALVCARDGHNNAVFYPLVHTVQKNGVCHVVTGHFTPESEQEKRLYSNAVTHCSALLNILKYRGVLAVEYFETPTGELIINEIAPRVHNSAHYTLDAVTVSQFEQHIRAITHINVTPPVAKYEYFAMVNLLGGARPHKAASPQLPPQSDGLKLYWYDKQESRPGRKMGHINVVAQDQKTLDERIAIALNIAQSFANI